MNLVVLQNLFKSEFESDFDVMQKICEHSPTIIIADTKQDPKTRSYCELLPLFFGRGHLYESQVRHIKSKNAFKGSRWRFYSAPMTSCAWRPAARCTDGNAADYPQNQPSERAEIFI
ncbi:hypothetical protein GYMLUDRAFT_367813 [Collybiopsis luxurians FD-317 M1]|nr:hypothetical protein GYMLUDRAFT_367813 [Collybiopsis luxurians FD-317 M1]